MQPKLLITLTSLFAVALAFAALSIAPQANAASTTSITITSSPNTGSGYVTIDGTPITTPATFNWNIGENHTIEANSTVTIIPDQSRYAYANWSDNQAQTHTITITTQTTTYTANYQTQYHLSVTGGNGISFSNPQPGNWYVSGAPTTISTQWASGSFDKSYFEVNGSGVVWLPFDEGSGLFAYDYSSNGNNGSIVGANWVEGKFGTALSFDAGNYVDLGRQVIPTRALSYSLWVKNLGAGTGGVGMFISPNSGSGWLGYFKSNNELGFNGVPSGYIFPNDSAFHFVVFTWDGQSGKFYVDNHFISSFNMTSLSPVGNTFLGKNADGNYFNGTMDEVHIYDRSLSASEIDVVYRNYLRQSRMVVSGWALDGVNQTSDRQGSGNLTTSQITMSACHTVNFA
ncbi:MAG: LamG domain-containing protein, partial [Candidatus Bathyarchaeia archaeon]